MGKIYSVLTRPIRTFNIENRAAKLISREKPVPAPQYASTEKQKKLSDQVNPHFLEDHYQKNTQLDQRLKDVFVTSTDSQEMKEPTRDSKVLPQSRRSSENGFTFESYEPTMIPMGKCSLKQALTFLLQHKRDPIKYSSENIASEYKMDKKVIDDILKYFKLYVTASPNNPEPVEFLDSIEDPIQDFIDEGLELRKKDKEKKK
ncbi:PREDICTED: protein NDUFAF4 homolog [Trachymyrmex cornetzi]|uniref:Protein NDUFAF4 like protein n=1 Tax=Trachymyrmex cornetzi TaxID=471704 RepID=A0A151JN73_9HYME|nr:PREDICTED: protein NDUFAF4 homolog [Trachymyrmex cornetzi]XP_018378510.1 PREDICTED: protein NDUFAF4 homolog [Trachymyrmex cornetzi]XP_018378511.1 PREDICTED: protein NDUFAF4 homolog [Trachymyrmex cornetzi]KYN27646.1 Protein NDUFAF4 like protein [Trachymyrmex cornetzi]